MKIDKPLVKSRFERALKDYETEAAVQKQIASEMILLLGKYIPRKTERVLEIGCGTGIYTHSLLEQFHIGELWMNDIADVSGYNPILLEKKRKEFFICGDAENCPLPEKLDLITSCSAFQWFEEPEFFIGRCAELLNPGGYLAFCTFGPQNMKEIEAVTGEGLNYHTAEEWKKMAEKASFRVLHCGENLKHLYFGSAPEVLRHLKKTGVSGIRKRQWTKKNLREFSEAYEKLFFSAKGKPLTYHPVYIIARLEKN